MCYHESSSFLFLSYVRATVRGSCSYLVELARTLSSDIPDHDAKTSPLETRIAQTSTFAKIRPLSRSSSKARHGFNSCLLCQS